MTRSYMYQLHYRKESYDLFFFRNSYTSYNGKNGLECICSAMRQTIVCLQ